MKIAIHNRENSFSEYWINYCQTNLIEYKLVNCYDSNIVLQLDGCDALMWHHHHGNYKDILFAKQVLFSLEQAGVVVFPDFNTAWHFDDKVGQKYLLESIGAPFIKSNVFYDKESAFEWVRNSSFPKVFKLRSGAGSSNVKLIETSQQANKIIKKAFGKGFPAFDKLGHLKDRYNKYRDNKETLSSVLKGFYRLFVPIKDIHLLHNQNGYVYFQDFLKGNKSDTRVIVVDDKAFAIKRLTRKNDFRASGSGTIIYDKSEIDIRCITMALETSRKLKGQCLAYDFIFDEMNNPLIVEISYGFSPAGYKECPGYWDSSLTWIEGKFDPYGWMVQLVIEKVQKC